MNLNLLKLHGKLIAFNLLLFSSAFAVTFLTSDIKPFHIIEWMDVVGEGGTALMVLIWIFFVLISRPSGRVTQWLVIGLGFLFTSLFMDLLDEFFRHSGEFEWLRAYESIPAPIGMVILTFGLYQWHLEQLSMNAQLLRRERVYREHGLIDYITGLYSAEYMEKQIEEELSTANSANPTEFSLLMLDIDKFDHFVRQHGDEQGDRFLRELSELMLMNIRVTDLACRYAGDRFIIILPETTESEAQQLANQLQQSIAHLAFKPANSKQAVFQQVSISQCSSHKQSTTQQLLAALNQQMEQLKLSKRKSLR